MPTLRSREKVLVQYRLLKDFDELSRRGIPGIDVRVMEDNIYEWHVTMSPLSGHFSGLRLHLIILFPEDYPRRPPKVELCTFLPHANVFRDFLTFAGYFAGYEPVRGTYVICTDLLEDKPRPLDPNGSRRYDGWSVAYSVESVLVQLQCLLFDDYVQSEDGHHVNTLWDRWYSRPGEGRKCRRQVCADLHQAQREADDFVCHACGYSGLDSGVAFYDGHKIADSDGSEHGSNCSSSDDEDVDDGQEGMRVASGERYDDNGGSEGHDVQPKKTQFVSRKKQRKAALQKQKIDKRVNTKVDFKQQRLYLEISNSNSALVHGHALRRVPGVFKVGDVVSFYFHGVEDSAYVNGHRCINRDLNILNYGHEVEFPRSMDDIMTGRTINRNQKLADEVDENRRSGKSDWQKFVNSQGGGSSKAPADTPGTLEYVSKRETFHPVGVIEFVNPDRGTVSVVFAGRDGKMGANSRIRLTDKYGAFSWSSDRSTSGEKAVLYKNVPLDKVKLEGCEKQVVPYKNEPPVSYKPMLGHFVNDKRVEYDLSKDVPIHFVKLLEVGADVGLTKQHLAALSEDDASQAESSWVQADGRGTERSFDVVDGRLIESNDRLTEQSFEIVSVLDDDTLDSFEAVSSRGSSVARSFDIISMVDEGILRNAPSSNGSEAGDAPSSLSSFHIVPSEVSRKLISSASIRTNSLSAHCLFSCRGPSACINGTGSNLSWEFLKVVSNLNIPIRGVVKSIQSFGAFVCIDATPRDLALRNEKLCPARASSSSKGKGKGAKGKGKGTREAEKVLQDGLLPCLSYMRSSWLAEVGPNLLERKNASLCVINNVFDDLNTSASTRFPSETVVYVNSVDVEKQRLKLSLQPRLTFNDLIVGAEYEGVVVDCSKQNTLGLFVALSDDLVGLLHKSQLGAGDWAEQDDGYWKRCVYKVGDRLRVWLLKKEAEEGHQSSESRRKFKIDLTMDPAAPALRQNLLERCLQVRQTDWPSKRSAGHSPPSASTRTAVDVQLQRTYDKDDKYFLLKNNRIIHQAEQAYPQLVIDYTTDPPPPPPVEDKEKAFDFSLIDGWNAGRITEEHRKLTEKKDSKVKPLSKEEEKLLAVLQKKAEQWGKDYYDKIAKKVEEHHARVKEIYAKIKEERDKYPYKSIIELDKFRELTERIKEKEYDMRCCYVTRLSYKEDVLGVGLEIKPEADTGRNVFHCSFDLLSKEAFYDFGVRSSVWKDKIQFWMPAAIDASHFRRALPYLADCFKQLGDGRVEKLTRSYGTQSGSAKYNLKAQIREAERNGGKIMSLDDYRKEQQERKKAALAPLVDKPSLGEGKTHFSPKDTLGLTEQDVAYGLEVLPKLMNLQTVQLMKGDLHLSTKALEGYMGFHHLLLSILRQYPRLQDQVEENIATFLRTEVGRTKQGCPNIGEFLCLFAVSRKYTWDDVSAAVLKETLDRNASWAIDKFPVLAKPGITDEVRLEKTFRANIVSIRLLCFNVWFLRNIVFKEFDEMATTESAVAAKLRDGPQQCLVDKKWEQYEDSKGIPKPYEVELLQDFVRTMMHGDGLNSWSDYFVHLNLKPLKPRELSQLLGMCLDDAVRKGYIPLWKLRPKPPKAKETSKNDFMGADVDKYDGMFTKSGSNKW